MQYLANFKLGRLDFEIIIQNIDTYEDYYAMLHYAPSLQRLLPQWLLLRKEVQLSVKFFTQDYNQR